MNGLRSSDGKIAAPPFTRGPYEMSEMLIFNKPGVESFERYVLEENFSLLPIATTATSISNPHFMVAGTNASVDDVTFASTIGGLQLQTDGATSDSVIIAPQIYGSNAWDDVKWGTENQTIWESVIRTGASVADTTIWAGLKLTNTPVVATDDDAAYFRFDGGVANWEATTSIAGTDVETDTGIVVAASTNYYLRIEIDSDRKAHFFINNKQVYVSTALTNDKDLKPYVGVLGSAGSAKVLNVVKEKISRIIYE